MAVRHLHVSRIIVTPEISRVSAPELSPVILNRRRQTRTTVPTRAQHPNGVGGAALARKPSQHGLDYRAALLDWRSISALATSIARAIFALSLDSIEPGCGNRPST